MDKNGYLIDLSESPRTDFGKRAFSEQSYPQKVFSAIWELESDVNNGGFTQYFTNCWPEPSVAFSPEALRAIGAQKCAKIVEKALALLPPDLPQDADDRSEFFDSKESLVESLSALDGDFFAYPDNLTDLLFEFVSSHPKDFGPIL